MEDYTLGTVEGTKDGSRQQRIVPKSVPTVTKRGIMGKRGRAAGKRFELLVRQDLEKQGWVVCKWTNQVDILNNKLIPAKSKYNPFTKRVMSEGSGLPDYIAFKRLTTNSFDIMGVESKMSKYLSEEEKKKLSWLIEKGIFNRILIGYKPGRGKIDYYEFKQR